MLTVRHCGLAFNRAAFSRLSESPQKTDDTEVEIPCSLPANHFLILYLNLVTITNT